jgi:peptidoglycan L-alanyl-D-glutamate endopeptidase CwlK
MASRDLNDLHPKMQTMALKFLEKCHAQDLEVLIYCTYRSNAEQDELYKIGRTVNGRKVTNAKGGQSRHNFTVNGKPASLAFDGVPLRNGKPVWNNKSDEDYALWQKYGRIAKSVGLEWAGDWRRMREFPHCQTSL